MTCNVAFIGLGVMGYPMAGYISKAGHSVTVFNRTGSKADKWIKEYKGTKADTPAKAAENADYISSLKKALKLSYTNTLAICNVAESTLTRLSGMNFLMNAGPEISVADCCARYAAAELIRLCYQIEAGVLADVWAEHVIPFLVCRTTRGAVPSLPRHVLFIDALSDDDVEAMLDGEYAEHAKRELQCRRGLAVRY